MLARGAGSRRRRGRAVPERLHDPRREVPEPPGRRGDRSRTFERPLMTWERFSRRSWMPASSAASGSAAAIKMPWNDEATAARVRRRRRCSSCRTCSLRRSGSARRINCPAAAFAEREGSYVNYNDRLQSFNWAVRPPAGVKVEGQLVLAAAGHARDCTTRQRSAGRNCRRDCVTSPPPADRVPPTGVDLKVNLLAAHFEHVTSRRASQRSLIAS